MKVNLDSDTVRCHQLDAYKLRVCAQHRMYHQAKNHSLRILAEKQKMRSFMLVIISSLLLKQMSIILADVGTASSYGPPYIRE